MKRILLFLASLFLVSFVYGQVDNEQIGFDFPIQCSGGVFQVGERLKLGNNNKQGLPAGIFPPVHFKKFLQEIAYDLNFPDMDFEFKSLNSIKNRLISNRKTIKLFSQAYLIQSIVMFAKDDNGKSTFRERHEYAHKPNRIEEKLSHYENKTWVEKRLRIREASPSSDSIVVKIYKKDSSNWVLDKIETAIKIGKKDEINHFEITTEFFDERMKKKMKDRENRLGRKLSDKVSTKAGEEFQFVLKLNPTTQIGGFIGFANHSLGDNEKRKEFKPIGCGFSKPITFRLHYDDSGRLIQLRSEDTEIIVNYNK